MAVPDYYALLEIPPTASSTDIRKSYFRLAKVYHPDRQAGDDPAATERFLAIQTAYEVLIDPRERGRYETQREAASATSTTATAERETSGDQPKDSSSPAKTTPRISPDDERDARNAYLKVQAWLEIDEYEKALRAMRAIVRAVPDNPEYESTYGYLMALVGERLHAARDHCRRAVEAEPIQPDFQARLGYVYLKAGLHARAQAFFEEALRLQPSNELARRYRGGTSATPQKAGLGSHLKRLFGLR